MAPLPDNLTTRWYLDYTTGGIEHTTMIRTQATVTLAQFDAVMDNLMDELVGYLGSRVITGVRASPVGSNFSFSVPSTLNGQTYGSGGVNTLQASTSLSFVGRSSTGRRARLFFFGTSQPVPADFRLTTADAAPIGVAVTTLTDATDMFLAIDGSKPTYYPYANVAVNAYWQRNVRA